MTEEQSITVPIEGMMVKHKEHPYWVLAREDGWQLMTPTGAAMATFFIPVGVGKEMVKVPLSEPTSKEV